MAHHIAFLGTGIMGAPMAANLIKAGFTAAVWNRTRSKTDPLAAQGARVASSPADCVKDADYILSILDSGPVVREVFFDSKAADAMKRGAIFIDMASIPPKMAQEHAAWLKQRGVGHLDAPVSGGSFGAAEGSLAIMAGGEKADFDRTERDGVWKPMGRASYIGPAGSGQIAKLANQIMVACNIASVAQGLLFAHAGGADPAQIPLALAGGHADSRVLQEHGRRMIKRDFRPGAPIRNFVKDLDTVLATAGRDRPAAVADRQGGARCVQGALRPGPRALGPQRLPALSGEAERACAAWRQGRHAALMLMASFWI